MISVPSFARTPTRVACCLALAILAQSVPVSAQGTGPGGKGASQHVAPLAEALTGASKADYDAAKLLFADGDYAGALSKFKQAYERSNEPRLLWNMAVCEKNLRHYYRVQVLVQKYLQEGKGILSAEQQTQAQDLLVAIKGFVASVRIKANEAGATLTVDDQPIGTTPFTDPVPIDLGTHKLALTKPGFVTEVREIEVAGGTDTTIDLVLKPAANIVQMARMDVTAGSEDTIVFDDKPVARAQWRASVAPGPHTLRVTGVGKKPFEQNIELAAGGTRSFKVSLEDEGGKKQPLWLYITGGAVVAAGLAVGGYLLFKSEDKQAPQPMGSLSPGLITLGKR